MFKRIKEIIEKVNFSIVSLLFSLGVLGTAIITICLPITLSHQLRLPLVVGIGCLITAGLQCLACVSSGRKVYLGYAIIWTIAATIWLLP